MRLLTLAAVVGVVATSLGQVGPTADRKQMDAVRKAYAVAKAALHKHPTAQNKHAFAIAADRYATAAMTTETMTPHQRYPLALRLYREVLKVEPSNLEAENNSQMIIKVYKSMKRPIPK